MTLEERTREVLDRRAATLRDLWRLILEVRGSSELDEEERSALLARLYESLTPSDVKVDFMNHLKQYSIGVSYKAQMIQQIHLKPRLAAEGFRIATGPNPKEKDRVFAEALGCPVPATLATGIPLSELSPEPATIIKPVRGSTSRGVFFVDPDRRLHSLRTRAVFESLDDAMVEIDEVREKISADEWMVEQAILNADGRPANDIKVHVFYGVVGTTLEVAHGAGPGGEDLFCYYDQDLRPVDIGRKYIRTFEGAGVSRAALERAVEMSLASPTPFLRFDFYQGVDDVYLGEITPHPGASHAGHISPYYDRQLGGLFLDAHARLTADLLRGKTFPEYFRAYGIEEPACWSARPAWDRRAELRAASLHPRSDGRRETLVTGARSAWRGLSATLRRG
jgi:hypothetical protein